MNVKVYLSSKRESNLRKLADYLLNLPDDYEHFDMEHFVCYENETLFFAHGGEETSNILKLLKNHCNTVACAIGHGPAAGIHSTENETWNSYYERCFTGDNNSIFEWCFGAAWEGVDNTPRGAALRIYYMLDYGLPAKIDKIKENWFCANWSPSRHYVRTYRTAYDVVEVAA